MCSQGCLQEMEKFWKDSIRSLLIAELSSKPQAPYKTEPSPTSTTINLPPPSSLISVVEMATSIFSNIISVVNSNQQKKLQLEQQQLQLQQLEQQQLQLQQLQQQQFQQKQLQQQQFQQHQFQQQNQPQMFPPVKVKSRRRRRGGRRQRRRRKLALDQQRFHQQIAWDNSGVGYFCNGKLKVTVYPPEYMNNFIQRYGGF